MDLLVPEVISLISKLGAMMVLIRARFMSLCLSLFASQFATFLSWGSLGHLILRAFPRGVLGGSSGGT